MPQNISSETHQIPEVICNKPKWSSDSEGSIPPEQGRAGWELGSSGSASLTCLSNESLKCQQYSNNSLHLQGSQQHTKHYKHSAIISLAVSHVTKDAGVSTRR